MKLKERSITLVDYACIAGISVFVALICLCIVLLANGAKRSAMIPAQEAITSISTETTQSDPQIKPHVQPETAAAQPERYYIALVSPSVQFSSDTSNQPNDRDKSGGATGELVTSDLLRAKAVMEDRGNLVMMGRATTRGSIAHPSRRSGSSDRSIPRSVKMLIGWWRRLAEAKKTARDEHR
jgi:hypothetical protein